MIVAAAGLAKARKPRASRAERLGLPVDPRLGRGADRGPHREGVGACPDRIERERTLGDLGSIPLRDWS